MTTNEKFLKTAAYINTKWLKGRKLFPVITPYTQKVIYKVADLGKKEDTAAIKAAYEAFPAWSSRRPKESKNQETCSVD